MTNKVTFFVVCVDPHCGQRVDHTVATPFVKGGGGGGGGLRKLKHNTQHQELEHTPFASPR